MTGPQHDRLFRVLANALGTDKLLLIGDRSMIKIVAPGMTYIVAPRGHRPSLLRNRNFSLSFGKEAACDEHLRALKRLQKATEAYARRCPWFVKAVAAGRVFLKDSPAMLRYLATEPTKYGDSLRELEALRECAGPGDAAIDGLVDFGALQGLLLRVAAAAGDEAGAEPADRRPPADLGGHRLLFINFLHKASGLGEALSQWAAAASRAHGDVACATDWRDALGRADRRTIVFCFGLQADPRGTDCARELLRRASEFRHVVFADMGLSFDPQPLPDGLLGDGRFSLFLSGPTNYFGAMHEALPPENRIPYIPVVSRDILKYRLPVAPLYDFFFCAQSPEQDLEFLFRYESFFRAKKLLIGTKGNFNPDFPEVRRRFPKALFIPRFSQSVYLNLWRLARNIVIMYPEDWKKSSFTLTTALLSGRGIVTSPHPAIADFPPSCFLLHKGGRRLSDRRMEELYCDASRSRAASDKAEAFALRRLEFAGVVDGIVSRTLRRLAESRPTSCSAAALPSRKVGRTARARRRSGSRTGTRGRTAAWRGR